VDGLSFGAPVSGRWAEGFSVVEAGDGGEAVVALAHRVDVPVAEDIPVSADEGLVADVAVGAGALLVVDVAGIDVAESLFDSDSSGADECFWRGRREVSHFPVGMEGGEMERDIGSEVFSDPFGHLMEFFVGIVFGGDDQVGYFKPDIGFVLQVFQGVEDLVELGATDAGVEVFGEAFEIDVGGVHVLVEFLAGFGADVSGGDGDGVDVQVAASFGDIDGVFEKDGRIVIGKGYAGALVIFGDSSDFFRGGGVSEGVDLAGLGDVPVLAEFAGEVAAGGSE